MSRKKLQRLHDGGDKYANAIDFERKNIETMEEQIAIMKQKLLHQRRAMGGVNASKDNHHMIQKQIRIVSREGPGKIQRSHCPSKTLRDKNR